MKNSDPQGFFGRGFRLGKLGLSLTGSYLGYQAQNLFLGGENKEERRHNFQQKASRRVRHELESLKGPAMKLGQLLSMQTRLLPEEAIQELASLQMRAPGMHPTLARAQFKNSCGKHPEEVFREFEPVPFAAASLGQVHRAITTRGEKVAVKIQYPAIRAAIENDLELLRATTLPGRITGHAPAALLDELERGLLEETDYMNEARNAEFFANGLAHFPFLSIPKVHWDLTTDRVLTMSFIEGEPVGDLLQAKPSQAVRDLIGSRLWELYFFQIHCLQRLHADHHPGNYLFQPDGRIGLVDFGCVKRLSMDIPELARCYVERSWRQGEAQARHVLGLVLPQVPFTRARKMLPAFDALADILWPSGEGPDPPVDFGAPKFLQAVGQAMGRALRHRCANPELVFASRAELGLYNLLHQLRARVHTLGIWRRVQARDSRKADPPRADVEIPEVLEAGVSVFSSVFKKGGWQC